MELEKIRELKAETEKKILDIIEDFEKMTDSKISEVELDFYEDFKTGIAGHTMFSYPIFTRVFKLKSSI